MYGVQVVVVAALHAPEPLHVVAVVWTPLAHDGGAPQVVVAGGYMHAPETASHPIAPQVPPVMQLDLQPPESGWPASLTPESVLVSITPESVLVSMTPESGGLASLTLGLEHASAKTPAQRIVANGSSRGAPQGEPYRRTRRRAIRRGLGIWAVISAAIIRRFMGPPSR